ncbi:hypothetical protein D3C76_838310 [compost metagenome]
MAEAGDQPVAELGAADQAEVVGRGQAADPQVADPFGGQAQAQVGGEQAGAGEHEQGGAVERREGDERAEHFDSLNNTPRLRVWDGWATGRTPSDDAPVAGFRMPQPLRWMAKPAQDWLTGMISRLLILMCGGWVMIQKMVSAMSCGWIGSAPA